MKAFPDYLSDKMRSLSWAVLGKLQKKTEFFLPQWFPACIQTNKMELLDSYITLFIVFEKQLIADTNSSQKGNQRGVLNG